MMLAIRNSDGRIMIATETMSGFEGMAAGCYWMQAPPTWTASDAYYINGQFVPDLAKLTDDLCDQIDAQRNVEAMKVITRGTDKTHEYDAKAKELSDSKTLLPAVLAALIPSVAAARFPWAQTEAVERGMTLAQVFATYQAAIDRDLPKLTKIAARCQKAKAAVRLASSKAAKVAASNVTWP